MANLLDNPVWNALNSGNQSLAQGNDRVKFFDQEVSPFVAFSNNTPADFAELYNILPHSGPAIFVTTEKQEIPGNWKVLNCVPGFQMVYEGNGSSVDDDQIVPLTIKDVPQMLELTKLTNPGPFLQRTVEFGHYYGVFDGDKLVAMAGQRMHIANYAEISAVCTHPDYLGRGYARQLLSFHINRIQATGDIPVLHMKDDNERAIKIYESLGFKIRTPIYFYVLMKN